MTEVMGVPAAEVAPVGTGAAAATQSMTTVDAATKGKTAAARITRAARDTAGARAAKANMAGLVETTDRFATSSMTSTSERLPKSPRFQRWLEHSGRLVARFGLAHLSGKYKLSHFSARFAAIALRVPRTRDCDEPGNLAELIYVKACRLRSAIDLSGLRVDRIEKRKRRMRAIIASAICTMTLLTGASAATGPVATQCKDDIVKYCANETHDGGIRACLETNQDKVSASCQQALETTGGGMGKKKKN